MRPVHALAPLLAAFHDRSRTWIGQLPGMRAALSVRTPAVLDRARLGLATGFFLLGLLPILLLLHRSRVVRSGVCFGWGQRERSTGTGFLSRSRIAARKLTTAQSPLGCWNRHDVHGRGGRKVRRVVNQATVVQRDSPILQVLPDGANRCLRPDAAGTHNLVELLELPLTGNVRSPIPRGRIGNREPTGPSHGRGDRQVMMNLVCRSRFAHQVQSLESLEERKEVLRFPPPQAQRHDARFEYCLVYARRPSRRRRRRMKDRSLQLASPGAELQPSD